jgi:hypothetical protein
MALAPGFPEVQLDCQFVADVQAGQHNVVVLHYAPVLVLHLFPQPDQLFLLVARLLGFANFAGEEAGRSVVEGDAGPCSQDCLHHQFIN